MPKTHETAIPADEKSQALAISFSLLLLLAISAISLSFWNASESSRDAVAINLAGRQRMLSQRIAKDLLELENAKQNRLDTKLILQDLSHSYFLFDQTLTMLGQGNLVKQSN